MRLQDLAERLALEHLTPGLAPKLATEVTAGYTTDLLSDILANAAEGSVAVTIQAHLNVVAVAVHARLAAVILAAGRVPDPEVIARATEEGVVLFGTAESTFDVTGRLYALGLRGTPT
jgi:hypothetical protein